MTVIALIAMGLLVAHRRWRAAAWEDPAVIHALVWLSASICFLMFPELNGYPSWRTIGILTLGIISFSIGVAAADRTDFMTRNASVSSWPSLLPWLLSLLAAGALCAVVLRAQQLVPLEGRPDWIQQLRGAVTVGGQSFGWTAYVANLGFAATLSSLYIANQRHEWIAACLALIAATMMAVLLTGRTYIVLLAVTTIVTLSSKATTPATKKKIIVVLLAALVTIIVFSSVARQPEILAAGNLASTIYVQLLHYIPPGVIGFDYQIAQDAPPALGVNTFRTFFAIFKALGLVVPVVDLVRPFILTPISTNVYSAFSPYYADYGAGGVAIFFFFFGSLTGYLYRRLQKLPTPTMAMLYGILIYALVMQFFQDQYFSLLSQWIQLLIWTALLTTTKLTRSP